MLVGFEGTLGSGKTLSMTFWARYFSYVTKIPVYTNYQTSFSTVISKWDDILKIQNGILCLDEIHAIGFDSRTSAKDFTQAKRTHFILQTRKKNILVFYTSQAIRQVDNRLRGVTDFLIMCEKKGSNIENQVIKYQTSEIGRKLKLRGVEKIFKWYDTFEVVNALQ